MRVCPNILNCKKKKKIRKTWDKGNRRFSISKRIRNGVEGNPWKTAGQQPGGQLDLRKQF